MQIYDLLEKVIESNKDINIHAWANNLKDVNCDFLVCGTIEQGETYITKKNEPFYDGSLADFVAIDEYDRIVFGYLVESK